MKHLENFNSYKGNAIYSAAFVVKDEVWKLHKMFPPVHPNLFYHHSTIEFKPTDLSNIEFGVKKEMKIIGRLTTDKVDVVIVESPKSKNKYPHITLSTSEGIKPFESNTELEKHSNEIYWFKTPQIIYIVEGVFNGREDVINL